MKTHTITARSYRDLKAQLYPWESNLRIQIKTPEEHISKVLTAALQEEARWKEGISRPNDWKIDLTLNYLSA